MRVHLINPSDTSFGIGVITPRWLYVLAAATPSGYGDPLITDETLEQIQPDRIQSGDIVGIGIHTGNALKGMQVGRMARGRGPRPCRGGNEQTVPEHDRRVRPPPPAWMAARDGVARRYAAAGSPPARSGPDRRDQRRTV